MPLAAKCVPVASSWVQQFVLTCDDKLAVQFENGVCCLYPASTKALFDAAISWPSPGKFVHAFLYKKLAYKLIKPPCPAQPCGSVSTTCCPNAISATLYATITGGGIYDGSYALVWDGHTSPPTWASIATLGTCGISFPCSPADAWVLRIAGISYDPTSVTCAAFQVTFTGVDLTLCGGPAGATFTVTP